MHCLVCQASLRIHALHMLFSFAQSHPEGSMHFNTMPSTANKQRSLIHSLKSICHTLRAVAICKLVCSGHCIIYVMAPLVFQTYYPGWTAAFLWLAVIRTCFRVSMTAGKLPFVNAVIQTCEIVKFSIAQSTASPLRNVGATCYLCFITYIVLSGNA